MMMFGFIQATASGVVDAGMYELPKR
jgi:hypothetical protein